MEIKRNQMVMAVLILCVLAMTGCKKEETPENAGEVRKAELSGGEQQETAAPQEKEPEQAGISVRMEEATKEHQAEDGTLLLTVHTSWPTVTIPGNAAAETAINQYVKERTFNDGGQKANSLLGPSPEEALQWAEEDYKLRGKENWHGYELGIEYAVERADDAVISFAVQNYSYMGGAHPNTTLTGLNFSTKTRARLTLADVTTDEQAAVKAINQRILAQVEKEAAADEGMFFADYKENIGSILTEDTWYLAKDGMHVIGNTYIISPHAAGILDFFIPYKEADFLKPEYRK